MRGPSAEGRPIGLAPESGAATRRASKETGEDILEAGPAAGHAGGLEAHVVATAAETASGATKAPEEVFEAARSTGSGGEARTSACHGANRVVALAFLVVGQDRVCLANLLEPGFGRRIARVLIRVPLPRQLTVGLRDGLLVRLLVDSQDLVEVLREPLLFAHARFTSLSVTSMSKVIQGCSPAPLRLARRAHRGGSHRSGPARSRDGPHRGSWWPSGHRAGQDRNRHPRLRSAPARSAS